MKQHSNNTLTGCYNAILGGRNNRDAGYCYAGIYGFGITAVADCAFHAENYVVQNMPLSTGFGAPRQLVYGICSSTCCALLIV